MNVCLSDILDVHSVSVCEDGRTVSVWFDLKDGRLAAIYYELGRTPGQDQRIRVIAEAPLSVVASVELVDANGAA